MSTLIILIHGTFDAKAQWTAEGSAIPRSLVDLVAQGRCHIENFKWSGKNTFFDRMQAAEELTEMIRRWRNSLTSNAEPQVMLIGHSHGGNIALYAANSLVESDIELKIVTLGTPFLEPRVKHNIWHGNIAKTLFAFRFLPRALALVLAIFGLLVAAHLFGAIPFAERSIEGYTRFHLILSQCASFFDSTGDFDLDRDPVWFYMLSGLGSVVFPIAVIGAIGLVGGKLVGRILVGIPIFSSIADFTDELFGCAPLDIGQLAERVGPRSQTELYAFKFIVFWYLCFAAAVLFLIALSAFAPYFSGTLPSAWCAAHLEPGLLFFSFPSATGGGRFVGLGLLGLVVMAFFCFKLLIGAVWLNLIADLPRASRRFERILEGTAINRLPQVDLYMARYPKDEAASLLRGVWWLTKFPHRLVEFIVMAGILSAGWGLMFPILTAILFAIVEGSLGIDLNEVIGIWLGVETAMDGLGKVAGPMIIYGFGFAALGVLLTAMGYGLDFFRNNGLSFGRLDFLARAFFEFRTNHDANHIETRFKEFVFFEAPKNRSQRFLHSQINGDPLVAKWVAEKLKVGS